MQLGQSVAIGVDKVLGTEESEMSAVIRPFEADLDEADGPAPAPAPAAAPVKLRAAFARWRVWFVSATAAIVALSGTWVILTPAASESTDDAYVAADATTVAPKVRGLVAEILVHDNQTVHAGDPLVKIDAEEFDAKVLTAQADLADAQADVATAQAALLSLDAEERLASANVTAAQTAIKSSDAQAERATADSRRYAALVSSGAVARRDADSFRAGAISAEQDSAHAVAMLEVARDSLGVTVAKRATLLAALQKANANVDRARSAVNLALQDQRHALVLAPIDGVVGNRQVQQGDYVQPGSRLLTLVPLNGFYVTANFKETQTGRMHPGQRATVSVDAISSKPLTGVVESLAPGSGSQFALLPFEPGTGNFTKIVQRVPVRIRFDVRQADLGSLRPGLSVTAKVALNR
jgi:membrane fusion protein (multidrug efflux system)